MTYFPYLFLCIREVIGYTANILTIKTMDFDHVPNPGIMSPQFQWLFEKKIKQKIIKNWGQKKFFFDPKKKFFDPDF